MQIYSYVIDIIIVLVVGFLVYTGFKRGFLRSVILLVGYVAAIIVSIKLGEFLSQYIYSTFIYNNVVNNVNNLIAQGIDTLNINELAQTAIVAVPTLVSSLLKLNFGGVTGIETELMRNDVQNNVNVGGTITDLIITPTVVPLIEVIVCILSFAIMIFVVKLVAGIFRGFYAIPIIGPINTFLGGVIGIAQAVVFIFLIASIGMIMINLTSNSLEYFNQEVISKTYLFKYFFTSKFI